MIEMIKLREYAETDGTIIPVEFEKELPFKPVRMFFIRNVPNGAKRGGHAHKKCEQILIAMRGNFVIEPTWYDKNAGGLITQPRIMLDPRYALYAPANTWLELFHFTPGAVCLVLASRPYEIEDYIHDRTEIIKA